MVAGASTAITEHTDTMCFVNHHLCIVFFSETHNFGKIGNIAFHREHSVGDDELDFIGLALLELLFERRHVVVLVLERLRETQPAAFDD